MGKLAHAARSKPGLATKSRAAAPKAKSKPRAKASWTFGGFDGGKTLAAVGAQPKMEVSKPDDALELEADRIADRVMHGHAAAPGRARHDSDEMPGARIMRAADGETVQRKAQSQDEIEREERRSSEEERKIHRMAMGGEEEAKKVHRRAMGREEEEKKVHRMAMGKEEEEKKVHRMAMGKEEEKKVHRFVEGDGEEEGRGADGRAGDDFEEGLRFAQHGG